MSIGPDVLQNQRIVPIGPGSFIPAGPGASAAGSGSSYQGPCDVATCAEAFSVARAMTTTYSGPLFQLYNGSSTLDVGQTGSHAANMTTWSAFCSGVASNCVYSKIYAQIHTTSNDLIPSVFSAPFGPNCSTGGAYLCAAPFAIEAATGLPIISTTAPEEYTIAGDASATGITGGTGSTSVIYNGQAVTNEFCCGMFGIAHKYNAGDVTGTDFLVVLAYGLTGNGNWANCTTATTYCIGLDEEGAGEGRDYGTSQINTILSIVFNSGTNTVTGTLNGQLLINNSPPDTTINPGTSIHFGGGGDLGQPDPATMREGLITNSALSSAQQTSVLNNMTAFFSGVSFPQETPGSCPQATTFLARTSGVSAGDQTAMALLICGLVSDGLITGSLASPSFCGSLLDALYVFAITNSTTAGLDICGHTAYTITVHGSPTFTADQGYAGVEGSTTVFLDTGVVLTSTTNYVQNSAHMSAWSNTSSHGTSGFSIMGAFNAGTPVISQIDTQYTDGNAYVRQNDGGFTGSASAVANAQGFFVGSRSGASALKGYRAISGTVTDLGVTAIGSASPPTPNVYILGLNQDGLCSGDSNGQVMEASVGANLTLAQVTSHYSRLRTYLTTVAGISY
jgi:hypothetical protein